MGHASSLFFSANADKQTLFRRITPTDEQFDEQRERWNLLADYLRPKMADAADCTTRTWLQGSYKFGTQIRPVRKTEEFDIDLGFYFEWSGSPHEGDRGPLDLKSIVQSALEDYADDEGNDAARVGDPRPRCARIHYKNNFHIDVPVYHLSDEDERHLATQDDEWEASDPKRIYIWFKDSFDDAARTQVRRIVRYFKAWSALKFENEKDRPSSIFLTILIAEAALDIGVDELGQDDDALADIVEQISSRLSISRHVPNPVNPDEDLASRLTDAQWDAIVAELDAFAKAADRSRGAADETSAADAWQEVFEYLFPMPELVEAASIIEERHLPVPSFIPEVTVTAVAINNRNSRWSGRNAIGPIPKNCDIDFVITNSDLMPAGATVAWTVRNEGREAENTNDLGHSNATGLTAHETSAYRGRHHMDCTVRLNGRTIAVRRIPVEITGVEVPRRNPVNRPHWVRFRR